MEREIIIEIITKLFAGADERNWQKVESTMASTLLLDYTSMAGGELAELTPAQITNAWAAFLPGFDRTHHQLSAFEVKENNGIANAHYFGKAEHFIGGDIWIVEGSYDTELQKINGHWKITKHKLNFSGQSGNTNLPALAMERMKHT
ncbi:MAG TPA: nuclear transport factor 2 family protein [Mucilaginibacter sp.]